ncbi:hypothetical protein RhiirB3_510313 [Rhizophagus irregularis]|nr:hypothetical protein RhiirB3_510313 [Rhizophagus irregularis]
MEGEQRIQQEQDLPLFQDQQILQNQNNQLFQQQEQDLPLFQNQQVPQNQNDRLFQQQFQDPVPQNNGGNQNNNINNGNFLEGNNMLQMVQFIQQFLNQQNQQNQQQSWGAFLPTFSGENQQDPVAWLRDYNAALKPMVGIMFENYKDWVRGDVKLVVQFYWLIIFIGWGW